MVRGVRCAPCAVDLCGPAPAVFRLGGNRTRHAFREEKRAAHWITIPALSLSSHISRELRARPPLFPPRVEFIISDTCSNTMWLSAPSLLDSGGIRLQRTSSYIGTSVPFGMVASEALAPPLALAPPPPMVAPSGLALRSLATPSNTAPHPACPTAAPRTHASLARGSMATVTRVGRCYVRRGRRGGRNGSSNWC